VPISIGTGAGLPAEWVSIWVGIRSHPRIHAAGVLYHVMARGNNGQKIFLKRDDYQAFLNALSIARRRYPFHLYAYVLMSNHFHLLLEVSDAPTSRIMQSLLTGYARRFNAIHRHKGHLFQGRYKAIVCDRESHLLELVRYIHLNPVRAGLVKRPGEWRWSGHQEYLGQDQQKLIDPGPVMAELHSAYSAEIATDSEANRQSEKSERSDAGILFIA
jgi:putative transposase